MASLAWTNYRRELRWTALVAGIVFVPLVGLGFVFANPHGSGNIATHYIGLYLLLPIFTLSDTLEGYHDSISFAALGVAQFIWSWLLVVLLRVSYTGALPIWRRFTAYIGASRNRKVALSILAAAIVVGVLFPVRSVTVPSWRVQFVDTMGMPFANIPVRQIWVDSGLDSVTASQEAEAKTDAQGIVEFPERARMTVFIANWSARTLYSSISRHSYIVQLCDLMDHGDKGAMYLGDELPNRVALRYSSGETIRHSLNLPKNPECTASESQAQAADSAKGITDPVLIENCGPDKTATLPPNPASQCGRAPARAG